MQTDWIINQNTQEIYIIKIIVISIMTYFVNIKLLNITKIGRNILNIFLIIGSCIISGIIREKLDLLISLLFLVCTLSSIFSICAKSSFGYSLLINIISLSINHVLFLLAIIISYLPFGIFQINNEIVNLLLILLLYILIVTIGTDIFAYFTGYFIGKHKLCEKISPKKTIEGAVGGSMIGTVIATTFYLFVISSNINIFLLGGITLLLTIIGQIGDLFFSSIKRYYEVKDFSKLIPGHGGVLDRLDSIIFVVLTYILFMNIL